MHRGSSKDAAGSPPAAGSLPLSASPAAEVEVVLEMTRAGTIECYRISVPRGASVRVALRAIGAPAEGSAVLLEDRSIPLDTPIDRPTTFTVVRTFSGG